MTYKDLLNEKENLSERTQDFLDNYDFTDGYVSEAISEYADAAVDLYTGELLNWLCMSRQHLEFVDDAIKEFGKADRLEQDIQRAQYISIRDEIEKDIEDLTFFFAVNFVVHYYDISTSDEVPEELEQELRDIAYDHSYSDNYYVMYNDIKRYIDDNEDDWDEWNS